MSQGTGFARQAGAGTGRLMRAWRALGPERRLAACASLGLFFALFLPWYQETVVSARHSASASLTGWASFSFAEAALLLVAAAVLTLLFERAEGRAFHLPGGDGGVITMAGAWACLLVVWRILDKPGAHVSGTGAATSGVEWGIFVALAVACSLTYAGDRIRRATTPEPPLPDEDYEFALPVRRHAAVADPPAERAPAVAGDPPLRARPRTSGLVLPTPDELADPPSLHFGPIAPAVPPVPSASGPGPGLADPDAALAEVTDEQLTIRFDELDR